MENRQGIDENSTTTYRTVTREELRKMTPIIGTREEDMPGEGSYSAYFRSENRNYKSIEFRMPQEVEAALAPDTAKLEDLMDEACAQYVKAWKLADARCREIIQDGPAALLEKRLNYEFEQSLVRIKLLSIKSKMEAIVYGQYEKGIATGKLPAEVVEPMTKALESYRSVGVLLQEKSIEKAKSREAELGKQIRECRPGTIEKTADIVTECAKAQQKAYQAAHSMHNITTLRPFYDGTWAYRGKKVISAEAYMSAMKHDITWSESAAGMADLSRGSSEIPEHIRQNIRTEYGL